MTYVREHNLANQHPVKLAGDRRADAAVKAGIKYDRDLAAKKRQRAEKLLEQASELESQASDAVYGNERRTRYHAIREQITEKAYWAAREVIGQLPRDDNGDYTTPAPLWRVEYKGEFVAEMRGEEYSDVLREICPPSTDERRWKDFEVNIVPEEY